MSLDNLARIGQFKAHTVSAAEMVIAYHIRKRKFPITLCQSMGRYHSG